MKRRNVLAGVGGAVVLAGAGALGWRSAVGSAGDYQAYTERLRAPLPAHAGIEDLVRYATLAANSHNTQPWRFRAGPALLDILPDLSRATPAVDPDDHHLFVSLGCAAENLAIAGAASGRPGELMPQEDGSVRYAYIESGSRPDPLLAAIPQRQSTRALYDGRPVAAADIETLQRAARMPGVRMLILTDRAQVDRVRDLVVAGNDAQMADPAFRDELKAWLRFNPRSAMATGDGLLSAATGNPSLPDFLGRRAFDVFVNAASENEKCARHIDSSAGIAVFLAEREDRAHWVAVGRACQRFALAATTLGLKHAYVNQPVEVAAFRPELAALVGVPGMRPDLVLRFGRGPTLPYSPRRPPSAVLG
ncbi:nitroreductase family protein [Luteimonas sp. BDR2-5]|uniref:Acg family FMN-binding oxidoreductase n=1 Tax=Proluteimonas luteida TaxID=2878685 RepID=UPI001E5E7AAF|nr:nitroreductase family protein [Luteimonas sp. BDR2-5]MCD9029390.1 nitroreductase family protein [Luteimonas sp. BDR2-5]